MCEVIILTGNLTDEFPSLAGQSVYFALQLKADHSSPAFAMEIDAGSGGGGALAITTKATITTSMGWQLHKIFATLPWEGVTTFRMRVFGSVSLQVGVVAIAPIGEAWLKSDDEVASRQMTN